MNTGAWIHATGVSRGASGTTAMSSPIKFAVRTNPGGVKTTGGNKLLPDAVRFTRYNPVIAVTTDSYDDVLAHEAAVNTVERLLLRFNKSGVARKLPLLDVMAGRVAEYEAQDREGSAPTTQWLLEFHVVVGTGFPDPASLAALFTDVADA